MKGVSGGDTEFYHHQMLALATWCAALMKLRLKFITGVETSAQIKQESFLEVNKTVPFKL